MVLRTWTSKIATRGKIATEIAGDVGNSHGRPWFCSMFSMFATHGRRLTRAFFLCSAIVNADTLRGKQKGEATEYFLAQRKKEAEGKAAH